jgi:protein deglycase
MPHRLQAIGKNTSNAGMVRPMAMLFTAAVVLVDGFEETEAVVVADVLRRADVDVALLGHQRLVKGSHNIMLQTDTTIERVMKERFDIVVLPGGMPGAATLRDDKLVQEFLQVQHKRGAKLAAICAAPIALAPGGFLSGKRATCFPGFEDQLGGAVFVDAPVVVTSSPAAPLERRCSLRCIW